MYYVYIYNIYIYVYKCIDICIYTECQVGVYNPPRRSRSMRRFSPPNNEQRKQNIGFMRFGMGFMRFRIRNALNPLVFQWDSWDLVQEMLWIHCCSIGFPLGFHWFLNPKLGFSRRVLSHRGWPPMLINRVGPTQSSIKKDGMRVLINFGGAY